MPMKKQKDPLCGMILHAERGKCASCEVRALSICAPLDRSALEVLADLSEVVNFRKGDSICAEGDPVDYFFTVQSGALKTCRLQSGRRDLVTGFLFGGDFLGLAFFAGQIEADTHYPYAVRALSKGRLCRLPRQAFSKFIADYPLIEKQILAKISLKLEQAENHILLLGRKNAREKISSFILQLDDAQRFARQNLESDFQGVDTVDFPLARHDIADYLGMTPETVSRALTQLKEDGLIRQLSSRCVALVQRQMLEEIAAG